MQCTLKTIIFKNVRFVDANPGPYFVERATVLVCPRRFTACRVLRECTGSKTLPVQPTAREMKPSLLGPAVRVSVRRVSVDERECPPRLREVLWWPWQGEPQ